MAEIGPAIGIRLRPICHNSKEQMIKRDIKIERMFSRAEIAELLGMSARTVDRFIKDGHLIAHKLGRSVRIAEVDFRAFVARSRKA